MLFGEEILPDDLRTRLASVIRETERLTSAEIRLHVEDECHEEVLDRAAYLFAELGMHRTAARNGVLIYVALEHRKLAILGDAGVSRHLPHDFWEATIADMVELLREDKTEAAFALGIRRAGDQLKTLFPLSADDRNELSNEVTTRKRAKP